MRYNLYFECPELQSYNIALSTVDVYLHSTPSSTLSLHAELYKWAHIV